MKDWFENLEAREKLFVSVGAFIVVLSLIYGFAWAPLDRNHSQVTASVSDWQQSLAELRPLRGVVQNAASSTPRAVTSQQSPIIIVDQTLRSRGLEQFRRRSQPTTSNGIRIEFENVAFDELVLWLGDLADQYGMHVQAGSLSAGSRAGPGRINATLTLERAP